MNNIIDNELSKLSIDDIKLLSLYDNKYKMYAKKYLINNMSGGVHIDNIITFDVKINFSDENGTNINIKLPLNILINWYKNRIFDGNEDILYDYNGLKITNFHMKDKNTTYEFSVQLNRSVNKTEEKHIKALVSDPDDGGNDPIKYNNMDLFVRGN